MNDWKPIKTYRVRGRWFHEVDLWMQWGASPLTMGMGDAFRVVDCYQRDGKWFHRESYQEKELNSEYITHWMNKPKAPRASQRR